MHIVIKVEAVCKSYGLSQVINNCSFQIHQGEIYGLLILDEPLNGLDRIGILSEGYIRQEFSVEDKVAECGEKIERMEV